MQVSITEPDQIGIVIPCYKQGHLVTDALQSLVGQTYPHWRAVVINDGSPDDTSSIVRSFIAQHPHCSIELLEKENEGLAAARNSGLERLETTWYAPLDSDDKYAPTYLERMYQATQQPQPPNVVYCDVQEFGARSELIVPREFDPDLLKEDNIFPYASLVRRELWLQSGGYPTIIPFGCEDYAYWLQSLRFGLRPYHLHEPLFLYRKHQTASMVDAVHRNRAFVWACTRSAFPALHPTSRVLEAHELIAQMNDDQFAEVLKLHQRFPQKGVLCLWLGLAHERRGRVRHAERYFHVADDLTPNGCWQSKLRALLLMCERREMPRARQLAREVLELDPSTELRSQLERIRASA